MILTLTSEPLHAAPVTAQELTQQRIKQRLAETGPGAGPVATTHWSWPALLLSHLLPTISTSYSAPPPVVPGGIIRGSFLAFQPLCMKKQRIDVGVWAGVATFSIHSMFSLL